jgi:hypothetical protein
LSPTSNLANVPAASRNSRSIIFAFTIERELIRHLIPYTR